MSTSRAAALALLNAKATGVKTVCHAIATELDLHNSSKPSGPSIVPLKLWHAINARCKKWGKVLALLKDPWAHDVEIDKAEVAYLASTKQEKSLVSLSDGVFGTNASPRPTSICCTIRNSFGSGRAAPRSGTSNRQPLPACQLRHGGLPTSECECEAQVNFSVPSQKPGTGLPTPQFPVTSEATNTTPPKHTCHHGRWR
jgi:hypothetical protein